MTISILKYIEHTINAIHTRARARTLYYTRARGKFIFKSFNIVSQNYVA